MTTLALAFALRVAASLLPIPGMWGLDTLRVWPLSWTVPVLLLGALGFAASGRARHRARAAVRRPSGGRAALAVDLTVTVCVGLALFQPARSGALGRRPHDARRAAHARCADRQGVSAGGAARSLGQHRDPAPPDRPAHQRHRCALPGRRRGGRDLHADRARVPARGRRRARHDVRGRRDGDGRRLHAAFRGYDKFGPLLAGIAIAAWGAARLAREGRGAWAVGAGVIVCLLSHRSGFLLVPAAAWTLAQGFRTAPDRRARIESALAALAIVAVAGYMIPKALHLLETIDRRQNLEGPPSRAARRWCARSPAPRRAPRTRSTCCSCSCRCGPRGSPPRGSRAAPGAARMPRPPPPLRRKRSPSRSGRWRCSRSRPRAALLLTARGAQGAMRDWDMHVGAALVVALATAGGLIATWRRRGAAGSLAPVVTTSLAALITMWGTHVSEPLQMALIRHQLADRGAWSDGAWARAHDFLGVRALQHERPEDAIRELEAAAAVAPNPRFFFQIGLAQRMLMRSEEAKASFEKAHQLDPKLADAWVGFALIAFDEGNWRKVEACAESALVYAPHRKDAKEIRDKAKIAIAAGR
jgi:hypothetical protein